MWTTDTPHVDEHRRAVADRLAAAPGLVLALDFDGTLAPIVEDPDDATLTDDLEDLLQRFERAPTVEPAVVSGRGLADLRERVAVEGIAYAGNHGLELLTSEGRSVPEGAEEWRRGIDAICVTLADRLADVPGCRIEDKGLTATVHVRQVPAALRDGVERVVRDVVDEAGGDFEISAGKKIWEIRPPIDWDKGHAVERLVTAAPDDWLSLYLGDDVTDEDAFATLSALDRPTLGVLIGDRNSAADYRLPTQTAVAPFLTFVADNHGSMGGN